MSRAVRREQVRGLLDGGVDLLLVERKLAESRSQAQALIMAGQVRVEGQVEFKPAAMIDPAAEPRPGPTPMPRERAKRMKSQTMRKYEQKPRPAMIWSS